MGKVPFQFPSIEREFMRGFAEEVGENARILRERYMAPNNVLRFSHGHTWEAPANTYGDTAGEMKKHGTETMVSLEDIAAGNVKVVFEAIYQVTDEMNAQMERMLIGTMGGATEKSGQVVDGSKKSFLESMYEMLEMMELPLNGDGEVSMPTLFIHPSQSSKLESEMAAAGKEFEDKFSALKEKKRVEAVERERQRLARFEKPEE